MRRDSRTTAARFLLIASMMNLFDSVTSFHSRTVVLRRQPLILVQRRFAVDNRSDDYVSDNDDDDTEIATKKPKKGRWDSLNPKIKERVIKAGQERAIANKKKREPVQDKKRRRLLFVKEKQTAKKRAARVRRPLRFGDRIPLSALLPGMSLEGVVISLTKFGAYVDIGTEVDGLLHISQMSADQFIEHPRQMLSPGDEIMVTIRSTNPVKGKLHLTLLPPDIVSQQQQQKEQADDNDGDRIPLTDIQVDEELWGEIKRVTDYGAYVEVGAVVDGFLHFMDHPAFVGDQRHPTAFMAKHDRVRVWVSNVDPEQNRIKLTAIRPFHLPGPRRELLQ